MKSLRWLPFAFLAGQHGFVIIGPYLVLLLTIRPLLRWNGKRL